MMDFYRQDIEILIRRESDLFCRIEKYAERKEMEVIDVVNLITQVGMNLVMDENLKILEEREDQ